MAYRSTAAWRRGLLGFAAAGALAGSAGGAAAQYYYEEEVPSPPAAIYGYGPRYGGYGYGYGYGYEDEELYRPAPRRRAPVAVTPDAIGRIAFERYGITRIERLIRSADAYIVEGARADGRRQRLVLDAYAGSLVRRQALSARHGSEMARTDPREQTRPRTAPKPPERPAELKPQAAAPSAAPATGPEKPAPATPAAPPVEASAPAAEASPPAPARPAEPPAGAAQPKLVNPDDVRAPEWSKPVAAPADKPPQATAAAPAPAPASPAAPATAIRPVQGQDGGSALPKPDVVIPPVTPLE